jgi:hypothetical protein
MLKPHSILIPLLILLVVFGTGCTEDRPFYKLNGLWEGQNTNDVTGQQWNFRVLIEHRGDDISAVYTDYRGSRTLRNITYDGQNIGFIIDLYPEVVTYFGLVETENAMRGTWSYSGDENNGVWYLLRNRDPEDPDDDDDEEDTSAA